MKKSRGVEDSDDESEWSDLDDDNCCFMPSTLNAGGGKSVTGQVVSKRLLCSSVSRNI